MLRPQKGNTEVSFTDTLLNFGLRAYSVPEFLEYKSVQNAKVYQSTGMNKVCMEWTEYQSETSEELNMELYIWRKLQQQVETLNPQNLKS